MAELEENPQTAQNGADENVVYEYVELAEGQELPEGYEYEYEYVEVPEGSAGGDLSELDVVGTSQEADSIEDVELASAAEIEAAISPMNLDDLVEKDEVFAAENEAPNPENEIGSIPPIGGLAAEDNQPQISAPGGDWNIDDILGDVKEPQLDSSVLEEEIKVEEVPQFEISAGEESAASEKLFDAPEPEIRFNNDEEANRIDDTVVNKNDESIFVAADNFSFQNDEKTNSKEDENWFKNNNQGRGLDVGTVDVDKVMNNPEDNVSLNVEDYLEPGAVAPAPEILSTDVADAEPKFMRPQTVAAPVKEAPAPESAEPLPVIEETVEEAVIPPLGLEEPQAAPEEEPVSAEVIVEEPVAEEVIDFMPETEKAASEPDKEVSLDYLLGDDALLEFDRLAEEAVGEDDLPALFEDEEAQTDVLDNVLEAEIEEISEISEPEAADEPEAVAESEIVIEAEGAEPEVPAKAETVEVTAEEVPVAAAEEEVVVEPVYDESVEPAAETVPVIEEIPEIAAESEMITDEPVETEAVAAEVVAEAENEAPVIPEPVVEEEVAEEIATVSVPDIAEEAEPAPVLEEIAVSAAETVIPVIEAGAAQMPQPEEPIVVLPQSDNERVINPEVRFPQVISCTAEEFAARSAAARLISKNDGIQSFSANKTIQAVALNDIDFAANELKAWNLVLFEQKIMPLTDKVSALSMPRQSEVNRLVTLVKGGEQKVNFFNEDKLKIINATEACVAVEGRFVCGDLQTNSGLIINDYVTIPLQDFAGKALEFAEPVSGLLSGPNGTMLYFFQIRSFLIPNSDIAKVDAEKLQYKISKWYSGTLNDKYFEFDAKSPSATFDGNEQMNAIHVNVNNSSYGWNVAFDNGLSMNLRDLREYQTRFGKMPSPNGVISYGQTKLTFSNVERVVVYESAQYYFYS